MNDQINSTLGNIAALCEEIYNEGRVVPSDEKLDYDDFLQAAFLAYGDIAAIQYYNELRRGNANYYFSPSIKQTCATIQASKDGRPPSVKLDDYALLPYMSGIVAVYPKTKSIRDPEDDYIKMPAGSESLYGKPKVLDDLGLKFFVAKGGNLELWGGDNEGEVSIDYVAIGEETVVTQQIGWVIIKEVLKELMPGKQVNVDTHEDTDPNQTTYKLRLDQPQSIQ